MGKLIKKYWWILVSAIGLPIAINYILLIPAFSPIVGDNVHWLTFWGGYLGAVISSVVAFFVLFKQLEQNHKVNEENRAANAQENKENRDANSQENKENRLLQLRMMEYQQQMQWLNDMRKACIENIHSYDANQLNKVAEMIQIDKYKAFNMTRDIMAQLAKTDTNVAFLGSCPKGDFCKTFHDKRLSSYSQYMAAAQDIHIYIGHIVESSVYLPKDVAEKMFFDTKVSNDMKTIINKSVVGMLCDCPKDIVKRVELINKLFENVRTYTQEYLSQEQKRIDEILTKS